jgi:hypothetical protein
MAKNLDDRTFDVRVIEMRIRRGTVTADDYRRYLDALPDDADAAERCRVNFATLYAERHYIGPRGD